MKNMQLLVKLGSIAVHADEYLSAEGHPADAEAIKGLLQDPEVADFIKEMGPLLPLKRNA